MREEFYNIWVHDDEQLEELLNSRIVSRERISHWPLSYVEKVTTQGGDQLAYKSQHSASSVERKFYSRVDSPYILSPVYSGAYEGCDILLLPYLSHPRLSQPSGVELERVVLETSSVIQGFSDMPVFFDLSTADKLIQAVDRACAVFEGIGEHQGTSVLRNWITERSRLCYEGQQIGNVHGDLTAANVFLEDGRLRYILDWQRPMRAPVLLDSALAMRLAGIDAVDKYGDFGVLAMVCHFIWYSYAYRELLPLDHVLYTARAHLLEVVSTVQQGM